MTDDAARRDAETMMAEIEAEFRRACEATHKFMAYYTAKNNHPPIAEYLRRYGEWLTESQPFAASYRRISSEFPELMDRLHKLLLPIQREFDEPP